MSKRNPTFFSFLLIMAFLPVAACSAIIDTDKYTLDKTDQGLDTRNRGDSETGNDSETSSDADTSSSTETDTDVPALGNFCNTIFRGDELISFTLVVGEGDSQVKWSALTGECATPLGQACDEIPTGSSVRGELQDSHGDTLQIHSYEIEPGTDYIFEVIVDDKTDSVDFTANELASDSRYSCSMTECNYYNQNSCAAEDPCMFIGDEHCDDICEDKATPALDDFLDCCEKDISDFQTCYECLCHAENALCQHNNNCIFLMACIADCSAAESPISCEESCKTAYEGGLDLYNDFITCSSTNCCISREAEDCTCHDGSPGTSACVLGRPACDCCSAFLTNPADGRICAEGVVVGPRDDESWYAHWGAQVGFHFCDPERGYTGDMVAIEDCPADLSRLLGFRATIKGQVPNELRVVFGDTVDETDDGYIVVAALDEPADYLFADAEVLYASTQTRPVLDSSKFGSVFFQVASQFIETDTFSFCIEDLEVIVDEEETDNGDDPDAGGTGGNPVCSSDSLQIATDEDYWIDGCTNLLGLQGTWYTSTPRGDEFP